MIKAKPKLILEPDFHFLLFGLVSTEMPAAICNMINKTLKITMTEAEPLQTHPEVENIHFHRFVFDDTVAMCTYQLVANRYQNFYYLPELKNIDYFLKIQASFPVRSEEKIITLLRKTAAFTMVVTINPATLKKKDKLLF